MFENLNYVQRGILRRSLNFELKLIEENLEDFKAGRCAGNEKHLQHEIEACKEMIKDLESKF